MLKQKKVPMRMCLGCNEMKPKKELVRIVKNADGEISLDLTSKKAGRGAYICRSVQCLKKVKKSKRIEKAFGCTIPQQVYEKMEEEIEQDDG